MLKLHRVIAVLCLPLLLQTNFVHAEKSAKGDIEVVLQQHKVEKQGNGEALVAVERIKPGEVVEYKATYINVSNHVIHQLQATLPIPVETQYLPGTARPLPVMASVDGKNYAPVPLRKKIQLSNGKIEEQDIPVSEYRSLRWVIGDIAAGQKISVYARVHLAPIGGETTNASKK